MSITVREAIPDDRLGVRRVLDAAMLEVRDDLGERIEAGDVLVAEVGDALHAEADDGRPILGALVLVPRGCGEIAVADCESANGESANGESTNGEPANGGSRDSEPVAHVHAVAVRRARQGQGIGSALVQAAIERHPQLIAEFEPSVRSFYESLGFEIAPVDGNGTRLRGRYEAES